MVEPHDGGARREPYRPLRPGVLEVAVVARVGWVIRNGGVRRLDKSTDCAGPGAGVVQKLQRGPDAEFAMLRAANDNHKAEIEGLREEIKSLKWALAR
jgi:hypothetical protein